MNSRDFNQLLLLLIFNTILHVVVLVYFFANIRTIDSFKDRHLFLDIVPVFHLALIILFIWFIWRRTNFEKRKKNRGTHLVIWLGFLGMWIWLIDVKKHVYPD